MKIFMIISAWIKFLYGYKPYYADKRKNICMVCKYRKGIVCGVCGCFLNAKVLEKSESCPKGFWDKIDL